MLHWVRIYIVHTGGIHFHCCITTFRPTEMSSGVICYLLVWELFSTCYVWSYWCNSANIYLNGLFLPSKRTVKETFINCMFQILLWFRSCCCMVGEIKLAPYRFQRRITHISAWKNLVEQRLLATTWIQSNYVRKSYKRSLNIRFSQKPQRSHKMGDVFVRKKFQCPNRICFFDNCHNRYFRLLMKFAREKIDITGKRQPITAMVWKRQTFIQFQELLSQYWTRCHFAPSKITKEHTKLLGDNL